ncbi:MAG: DUF6603 domain-containing protein [Acidobacteriaceae bacterium]
MAGKAGTLEILAQQVGLALQPLQTQLTAANILPFLAQMGLQFPPQLTAQPAFMNALNSGATAAAALPALLTQLATDISSDNEAGILQDGLSLIQQIGTVVSALEQIGTELGNAAASLPGMNPAEVATFASSLPKNLLSYLLISYLKSVQPGALGVANAFGVVDYLPNPGIPGDATHPAFVIRQLQLNNFGKLLTSPADLLKTLFDWGNPAFDGTKLLPRLGASLGLLGLSSQVTGTGPGMTLTTSLLTIAANPATSPPGLIASLQYPIDTGLDLTLPITDIWSVRVQAQGAITAGLAATITPPSNVTLLPPTGTLNGLLQMDLVAKGTDASHPLILLGTTGGSRLQTDSFTIGAGMTLTWNSGSGTAIAEPQFQIAVAGGKVIIDMSGADGFLATVLAGIHVEAGFDVKATWAPDTGIHIEGGAQLEIDLPLHLSLGPVTLPTLYLVSGISGGGIPIEISAALGLTLGPLEASVDRVGIKGLLSFPDHGGNLGPANLAISFKPPNGLGISIDAGVVAGGGYILFNPDKGQYAGVLDVSLAEIIQVKVIGVLDTILPDGSHGFSFLLIITFDLPPIQLGFGFTLNGVGGLGGVNRTMNQDALHTGFRAHTLNNVLFPADPIANAPQIISSIESFFPPAQGRYLFGPMLEIGWGTPTLITLAVGIILEVPDPIRLALLGLIDAGLPTTEAALIELHIDVLGLLDFGAKTLSIDGSLYDSRVLIFSLAGDLALRLSWGDDPNFVFSLGGFNPHFNTTGLNLPDMHRLSVSIGDGDNPRISANSYFAITSNSIQFGANVEAYASAAGFTIHGYLGYDVLIIMSPFSFEFDFAAGFDVSFEDLSLCGLHVDGLFSGPRPWHLHGDASISVLFFSVSVSLDISWGDATPAILPQRAVLPDLLPALQDPRNWSTALPDGTTQAVTLSAPRPDDQTLRVHPIGVMSVRERVVPLDLAITRYGNGTPSDGNYFSLSDVQINGQEETKQAFQDYFATGQFLTLSDADKVSAPSFEKYDAGITVGSAAVISGADSPRTVVYEERYIDVPSGFSRFTRLYAMPANVHSAMTRLGAGFASPLKNSGLFKYGIGVSSAAVKTQDPAYVVTHVEDLSVRTDIVSSAGSTYFQARAALTSYLALHPEETDNLQIAPAHEVMV